MALAFEWDKSKAERNLEKHGVGFAEASTVFGDPFSDTVPDTRHSLGEERFFTFGFSDRFRLLAVSHADLDDGRIRIISARLATLKERRRYDESRR
jgi:uncharacterized DUF497 family protein